MALDTREKRDNALGVGRPWMRGRHPVGTTDEQSRMATGMTYGGNALTPSVAGAAVLPSSYNRIRHLVNR